jgi:hypothetical protein
VGRHKGSKNKNPYPPRTPEQRLACSIRNRGRRAWNKGLTKETDERVRKYSINSVNKHGNGLGKEYWDSPRGLEIRKLSSERMKGSNNAFFKIKDLDSWKKKCSHPGESNPWYKKISPGMQKCIDRSKVNHWLKGTHISEEAKLNIGLKNKGRVYTPEQIEHFRQGSRNMSEENKLKVYRSCHRFGRRAKNGLESKFESILNEIYPNQYKYVGNFELIINGKCPDFINICGQKKLIEVFGDYWHSKRITNRNPEEEEKRRIDAFSSCGYKTLIIWEKDLRDIEMIISRIRKFHEEEH